MPPTSRAPAGALWQNPQDLNRDQQAKLAWIQRTNRRLYRAYLLKEQLREVFRHPFEDAVVLLDRWLSWAIGSRLVPFVEVARMVLDQMEAIEATPISTSRTPASKRSTPAYG